MVCLASSRFLIHYVIKNFHSIWRADSKRFGFVCQIQRIRVDGSRIRKEKVADSKVPGYVWTRLAEKRLYWAAKTLDYIFLRFLSRIGVIFLQAHGL